MTSNGSEAAQEFGDVEAVADSSAEQLEAEKSFEIEADTETALDLPATAFKPINFTITNRRIKDLNSSYLDKELDPRPSFQRGYVWDSNRASKLVESILLHVPLPLVYTAEEEDGREVVIDGQQRLTTCFAFIEGFFPLSKKDEARAARGESIRRKPFKLGKLKILSHLAGKTFAELEPSLQSAFKQYGVQVIKITKDTHPDVKFEIFERLNTGSMSLSDQEIRNCIYRGNYNDLIHELANHPEFQRALSLKAETTRMTDNELVLRFLAFHESTYLNYNGKMRSFLNNHMRERRNISKELAEKYKEAFLQAVELTNYVFGNRAFRRYSEGSERNKNGKWENAINKALFDVIMFWFARFDKRQIIPVKDAILEKFIQMNVNDREFIEAITLGTADVSRVKTRFEKWKIALEQIVYITPGERRSFSLEEKTQLFEENPTCYLCEQRIESVDDAEVDHVVAFSKGGPTDIRNGRLAHRYCNRVKSDKSGVS